MQSLQQWIERQNQRQSALSAIGIGNRRGSASKHRGKSQAPSDKQPPATPPSATQISLPKVPEKSSIRILGNGESRVAMGWLYKSSSSFLAWKHRWVVLDPSARLLSYFEDEEQTKLKGVIQLSADIVVRESTGLRGGSTGIVIELMSNYRRKHGSPESAAASHAKHSSIRKSKILPAGVHPIE